MKTLKRIAVAAIVTGMAAILPEIVKGAEILYLALYFPETLDTLPL